MSIRIAMAQLNYTLCDFEGNLARITQAVRAAADADLIVFTELCLSGYDPLDLVEEPDFLARQQAALEGVLALSREVAAAIVIGAVTPNPGPGKRLYNSLLLIERGEIKLVYHKQLLPTYNILDDRRHYEPGPDRAAVHEIKGVRVGFLICEDSWNAQGVDYSVDPTRAIAAAGVDLIVSINASPSDVTNVPARHAALTRAAQFAGRPVLFVNQVGGNDQIVFDGGSFAVHPVQGIVYRMPMFEEAVGRLTFNTVGGLQRDGARLDQPVADALSDSEFYYRQIVLGLRDYVRKVGFKQVLVGSSGGIDSALTLALAVDALGAENVTAITMPSQFSSAGSVDDSATLCANLGVRLLKHPIAGLVANYRDEFERQFETAASKLTVENLQARIRGTILMEYANHFGPLLLTTGNKSEISVGYCTLYGDTNGGLNIIGDLYKTEVFALARYYNQHHGREVIPQVIIDKAPSAELSEGQKDTDSLPPYPVLDEILKLHVEGERLRPDEYAHAAAFVAGLRAAGKGALVDQIVRMVARAEFKRRQAPPIIRVRSRAFGTGRQMPIAAKY